jgi:hypothetical protein
MIRFRHTFRAIWKWESVALLIAFFGILVTYVPLALMREELLILGWGTYLTATVFFWMLSFAALLALACTRSPR